MSKLETRPTPSFKPDPNQPRKHFDEAELRRLGESLKVRQIDPIQALPDGTIIDGERRWRAAGLVGKETLDAIITDLKLTQAQIATIRLTTFFHRVDLSPYEKWRAVADCLEQNPDWDQKRAAEEFKADPASITRILSPGKCIPEVQEALKAGKITISDTYAISKLKPEDQTGLLALKLSGASRDDLERQGRKTRAASTATVRASKLVISLVTGVKVTISGSDLSLDEAIDAVKDAQREMVRGRDQGLDVKTLVAVTRDKAKAGV